MTDLLIVRDHTQPCDHDFWHGHPMPGTLMGKLMVGAKRHRDDWCPGGREIVLTATDTITAEGTTYRRWFTDWVEVSDE